jgi:hypothetical protein
MIMAIAIKLPLKKHTMNTKKILFTICSIVGLLYILVSCKKEQPGQTELPYLFRPIGFAVSVNKTVATITWNPIDSAVSYTLEISQDSLLFQNIIKSEVLTSTTYIIELAGNTRFSARVKANASNPDKNSKFNQTLTFKTPSENLFNGYSSYMYGQGAASIAWLPAANVTKLLFKATGKTDISLTIADNEKAAGKKSCTSLPNGVYTVDLYNNDILRGAITLTIEGDVWLNNGDDLPTALNAITMDSAVVILKPGIFNVGGSAVNFTKNIKIKGLYKDTLPTICMGGTASTTANMLNVNTTNPLNFLRFENVEFAGYLNAATSGIKIGYLFNQGSVCTVGEISFKNCLIHNIGNTPFRVKIAGVTISNLSFDNCRIYEIGYSSTYALVNNNLAGTVISNISFTNSSIYNFTGSLILHTTAASNSVLVQNCTFNQITTGTSRYFIDYSVTYSVANPIVVKNCIFGSTGAQTNGIRQSNVSNLTISGSYFTTDYIDTYSTTTSCSIMGYMTAYTGLSTALFTNPVNAPGSSVASDFTFKDIAFAGAKTAGDPRWWR